MFERPAFVAVLLFAGSCSSLEGTPSKALPAAVQGEPIVAFMDIGGVT